MADETNHEYLPAGDVLHVAFTEAETRRVYVVAEDFAHQCKAAGIKPPPDPLHALLCAAEEWANAVRMAVAIAQRERVENGETLQ